MNSTQKRKILIIAPFSKPEMTSWLILRAFNYVGLSVEKFDYRLLAAEHGIEKMNEMLKAIVQNLPGGSVALILKGDWINPLIFEGRWDLKRVLWFFDFDAYQPHNWLRRTGRWMTAMFLMCYPWVEQLREEGVNAFYLPQATDPTVYMPMPEVKKTCDVAFIGTKKPGRGEILAWVAQHFSLEVWGEDWQDMDFKPGKPAYLEDFCNACARAKIIINITPSIDWPIYEKTFSQRIYMAAGCGACILTDRIPGLDEFFDKNEIAVYDEKYLMNQIKFLLDNKVLRESIGKAARRRVLMQHQYIHRIKEMFTCLGLSLSALRSSQA